jgi:hypothetical protein
VLATIIALYEYIRGTGVFDERSVYEYSLLLLLVKITFEGIYSFDDVSIVK